MRSQLSNNCVERTRKTAPLTQDVRHVEFLPFTSTHGRIVARCALAHSSPGFLTDRTRSPRNPFPAQCLALRP